VRDKWLSWIDKILSSSTSLVILNGVPGKKFTCKWGVHQGDLYPHCTLFLQQICFSLLLTRQLP
jgi:hypothetical protein